MKHSKEEIEEALTRIEDGVVLKWKDHAKFYPQRQIIKDALQELFELRRLRDDIASSTFTLIVPKGCKKLEDNENT